MCENIPHGTCTRPVFLPPAIRKEGFHSLPNALEKEVVLHAARIEERSDFRWAPDNSRKLSIQIYGP